MIREKLERKNKKNIRIIYQIADIHIRLYSRHIEYREVFEKVYNIIKKEEEESVVVICGDTLHSKDELSPEAYELLGEFLENLLEITEVIIILGNHDTNLANKARLDSLSPLIKRIKGNVDKNLHYLLDSGEYTYQNITFGLSSLTDGKFIKASDLKGKLKVGLYHGPVHGSITDVGYRMNDTELKTDDFIGYDLVLLGDIHKYQYMDKKKRICYAGSLIQQNLGENLNDHGIVRWDLHTFKSELLRIKNDYGYVTLQMNKGKIIQNKKEISKDNVGELKLPLKPRLKIEIQNTNLVDYNKYVKELRKKFKIHELRFYWVTSDKAKKEMKKNSVLNENIRVVEFQNKMIKNFLKSINRDSDSEYVEELNKKYNERLKTETKISRKKWTIKTLEFENMFNYGTQNKLDFTKAEGMLGIFAPNNYGKSSLIDIILYCLYDKISRESRFKVEDILNKKKNSFYCRMELEIEGKHFTILRKGEKPKGNSKSIKSTVCFWEEIDGKKKILDGKDRLETNDKIVEYVGSYDDFLQLSLYLQEDPKNFINMGNSAKLEFISKLLRLDIFEDLNKENKGEFLESTQELKILKNKLSSDETIELEKQIKKYNEAVREQTEEKKEKEKIIAGFEMEINELHKKYVVLESNNFDIEKLQSKKKTQTSKLENIKKERKSIADKLAEKQKKIDLLNKSKLLKQEKKIETDHNQFLIKKEKEIREMQNQINNLYERKQETGPIKNLELMKKRLIDVLNSISINANKTDDLKKSKNELEKKLIKPKIIKTMEKNIKQREEHESELKNLTHRLEILEVEKNNIGQTDIPDHNKKCKYCKIFVKDYEGNKKKLDTINEEIKSKKSNKTKLEKILKEMRENEVDYKSINDKIEKDLLKLEGEILKIDLMSEKDSNRKKEIELEINECESFANKNKENQDLENKINQLKITLKKKEDESDHTYDLLQKEKSKLDGLKKEIITLKFGLNESAKQEIEIIHEIEKLDLDLTKWDNDKSTVARNKEIEKKMKGIQESISNEKTNINKLIKEIDGNMKKMYILEEKISIYKDAEKEYIEKEKRNTILKLYDIITKKDGLPAKIIKEKVPYIEEKINQKISELLNITIELKVENDKYVVLRKKENDVSQSVSFSAGSHKFLINMVIRQVLCEISNIATSQIAIIDEGFVSMDSDNLNNIVALYLYLRDNYKTSMIITHMHQLKSECDHIVYINKNNGFSQINNCILGRVVGQEDEKNIVTRDKKIKKLKNKNNSQFIKGNSV